MAGINTSSLSRIRHSGSCCCPDRARIDFCTQYYCSCPKRKSRGGRDGPNSALIKHSIALPVGPQLYGPEEPIFGTELRYQRMLGRGTSGLRSIVRSTH